MGLIAIGDIHGCARSLDALLARLDLDSDDHLVFVGDYIDRGPDSKGVVDRLLDLRERQPCTFLRGNHESFILDYLDRGALDLWRINGGLETLQSYLDGTQQVEIPEAHVQFYRATELYHETPEFVFVHAGLRPDLSVADNLAQCDERTFLWERSHLEVAEPRWEKTVVCGHTPQAEPLNRERLINIDTGCVYYSHPQLGTLTAVRLPEREFVSVPYEG